MREDERERKREKERERERERERGRERERRERMGLLCVLKGRHYHYVSQRLIMALNLVL